MTSDGNRKYMNYRAKQKAKSETRKRSAEPTVKVFSRQVEGANKYVALSKLTEEQRNTLVLVQSSIKSEFSMEDFTLHPAKALHEEYSKAYSDKLESRSLALINKLKKIDPEDDPTRMIVQGAVKGIKQGHSYAIPTSWTQENKLPSRKFGVESLHKVQNVYRANSDYMRGKIALKICQGTLDNTSPDINYSLFGEFYGAAAWVNSTVEIEIPWLMENFGHLLDSLLCYSSNYFLPAVEYFNRTGKYLEDVYYICARDFPSRYNAVDLSMGDLASFCFIAWGKPFYISLQEFYRDVIWKDHSTIDMELSAAKVVYKHTTGNTLDIDYLDDECNFFISIIFETKKTRITRANEFYSRHTDFGDDVDASEQYERGRKEVAEVVQYLSLNSELRLEVDRIRAEESSDEDSEQEANSKLGGELLNTYFQNFADKYKDVSDSDDSNASDPPDESKYRYRSDNEADPDQNVDEEQNEWGGAKLDEFGMPIFDDVDGNSQDNDSEESSSKEEEPLVLGPDEQYFEDPDRPASRVVKLFVPDHYDNG